ncbi:hypothetical protein EYR36_009072 [Pleurotus pulmonarius]|nr:hypothetical protein EYR36_009072 [Pleurotus pulmonarius]
MVAYMMEQKRDEPDPNVCPIVSQTAVRMRTYIQVATGQYTMALVYKDPSLVSTHMVAILEETYTQLMQLRARSGCAPDGRVGNHCVYFIDSCSFSNVRVWARPAFHEIRAITSPYPHVDPPVKPTHHAISLCQTPTDWGLPLAGLISRFSDFLTPKLSEPFGEGYDTCVYSFALSPWLSERVFSAAALKCHGKVLPKACFVCHIAVNMLHALREKRPDMTELQVFRALINVHFRQLVIVGDSQKQKIIYVEVNWVSPGLPLSA